MIKKLKNITLREFAAPVAFALSLFATSLVYADHSQRIKPETSVDLCLVRGDMASYVIEEKNAGKSTDTIKDEFYAWLQPNDRSGVSIGQINMVVAWYNDWGPEHIQTWFDIVYATYSDAAFAAKTEVRKCEETNNSPYGVKKS